MKKIFSVLLVFLILSGCTAQSKVLTADIPLAFSADFSYNEFGGKLTRTMDGKMKFIYTKPDSINGMQVYFSQGKCLVTYKGMKYGCQAEKYPQSSVLRKVSNVFSQVSIDKDSIKVTKLDKNLICKGNSFTIIQDCKDKNITEIKINSDTVKLNNFTKIK